MLEGQKEIYFLSNEIFLHNLQVHSLGAYLQQLVTWLPLHQPRRRAQDQFWAEEVLSFPLPHLPQDPFQDPLCQLQHHYPKIEYHLLPHLNHKIEYSLIHHKVNIFIFNHCKMDFILKSSKNLQFFLFRV